ncbi:unnamed protein product [Discosporangium mesarthrocarpum]
MPGCRPLPLQAHRNTVTQGWIFDSSPTGLLPIELADTRPLHPVNPKPNGGGESTREAQKLRGGLPRVEIHALVNYPIRGLVYKVSGENFERAGAVISSCVDQLVQWGIVHTMLFNGRCVFLLPRKPLEPLPFSAVPGFPELSGEVIITDHKDFNRVSADNVYQAWSEGISVEEGIFQEIVRACVV